MDGSSAYDTDVIIWSREQAAALRAGEFSRLDIEHLADEIEDVGKSEKRELASRMAVLLAHLLKWQFQPERRSKSWTDTINLQRRRSVLAIEETPSLKAVMRGSKWRRDMWLDALSRASDETGIGVADFPEDCPWAFSDVLRPDWLPD